MKANFTLEIDFTTEWYDADIDVDRYDEATDELLDLPGASEVCLSHCCWIIFHCGDRNKSRPSIKDRKQQILDVIKNLKS